MSETDLIERLRVAASQTRTSVAMGAAWLHRFTALLDEAIIALASRDATIAWLREELEDAIGERDEAYQEGYDEGKSEWRGVKAQLWNAMVHWLELRHGMQPDADGYSVHDLLDGLAEVEHENKRIRELLIKATRRAEAAEARCAELEKAAAPIAAAAKVVSDGEGYVNGITCREVHALARALSASSNREDGL